MFDVINEPWIKTDKRMFGIRELLVNAPKIHEIYGENPINEFAIYRFLFTFLMDALQIQTLAQRNRLLQKGKFDMDVVDAYIEKCRDEGVSFDIFDEKRPFLQENDDFKGEEKSIGYIDALTPTGTNKIFFNKKYENDVEMTNDEIARYLVTVTLHPKGGSGHGSCISGNPVYAIVMGNNLFETLVFGIIPINSSTPYGKPVWRNKPQELVTELLPALGVVKSRIRVLNNKKIRYGVGVKYKAEGWFDPYVPYFESGEKKISMKPKAILYRRWKDLLTLSDETTHSLKVVELSSKYLCSAERPLIITTYEGSVSKSRYTDMQKSNFELAKEYIGDSEKIARVRNLATLCEYISSELEKALKSISCLPYMDYMLNYHMECDEEFEKECVLKDISYNEWFEKLRAMSLRAFDDATCNLKTNRLIVALEKRKKMIRKIDKKRMKLSK